MKMILMEEGCVIAKLIVYNRVCQEQTQKLTGSISVVVGPRIRI